MIINRDRPVDRTGNSFCGPLVIAAILGTSTAEAAERVRRHVIRKCYRNAVKGMYNEDLRYTLEVSGFAVYPLKIAKHYVPLQRFDRGDDSVSYDWEQLCFNRDGTVAGRNAVPA